MNKVEQAVQFALTAHEGAVRKGTSIPYILHPLETASIAAQLTTDEDVIIAAVLHDVVEDTAFTADDIAEKFGARIAELVGSNTEDKRRDRPANETWEIRKQETLDHLRTASLEEKIIAFSDKFTNLRSTLNDYINLGESIWDRFQQKDPEKHIWYYEGVFNACPELGSSLLYEDYGRHLKTLRLMVREGKANSLFDADKDVQSSPEPRIPKQEDSVGYRIPSVRTVRSLKKLYQLDRMEET